MKKLILVACVGVLTLGFTSCKKDCECTTTLDGAVVGTTTTKAKNCSDLESSSTVGGSTSEVKCK